VSESFLDLVLDLDLSERVSKQASNYTLLEIENEKRE